MQQIAYHEFHAIFLKQRERLKFREFHDDKLHATNRMQRIVCDELFVIHSIDYRTTSSSIFNIKIKQTICLKLVNRIENVNHFFTFFFTQFSRRFDSAIRQSLILKTSHFFELIYKFRFVLL